ALFLLLSFLPPGLFGGAGHRIFASGNLMGVLGAAISSALGAFLGAGLPALAVLLVLLGAACFGWLAWETAFRWSALTTALAILLPAFLALFTPALGVSGSALLPAAAAGWIGRTLALPLVALLDVLGAALVLIFLAVVVSVLTVGSNPLRLAGRGLRALWSRRRGATPVLAGDDVASAARAEGGEPADAELEEPFLPELEPLPPLPQAAAAVLAAPEPKAARKPKRAPEETFWDSGDPSSTERPPLSLLNQPTPRDTATSEAIFESLAEVLMRTLRTFKVEGQVTGRTTGPVVTQFEVVPAPGIKVNRIAALDADLALALKANAVRIVAPIPGKGAVGVEVPNPEPEVVVLREILESAAFQKSKGQMPVALGKDLTGRPYVADLVKMPHLLIAGATGSGKSVCVNTIITSLVYRHTPRELRLLLVDPKMVELSMYGDLPHLRHPVITNPQDAAIALKWGVYEMERRYELLSENGARSILEFNRRVNEGQQLRRPTPSNLDETDPERWIYREGPLPYIVIVVDELADLMMAVQAEIEKPLAQLAQKARAIGIHLIVATQRPSVNVITGLIKANFPCRMAFRVSAKVDSRTILDQNGADALLGNGDMLFLPPGSSDPVRIQGAYLSTEETERLMAWYREQAAELAGPRELEEDVLETVRAREAEAASGEDAEEFDGERDKLFRDAAEVCIQFNQGSTSLLQRRLRIGYGRAARIIDQLHHAGVLGPPDGSRPREVLVGFESLEAICGTGE
ncbi:MAG TPA: DNA translocase FtsK 4TM domain-containing protein, partial [Longimicrobiales bacterium]